MSKIATFRFYAELNDFLTPEKRQVRFEHVFNGQPSIKDVIESIGVPHTEIDLILVNQQSVDFNYQLQVGDDVAVYPVFEALDIEHVTHLRPKPLCTTRFILDVHLGKLARYLRLLGFDSYYNNSYDDPEIIRLAVKHQRIILTRDLGIFKHKQVTHGYWLRETASKQQVLEVIKHFQLQNQISAFSRCIECNSELLSVEKEHIAEKLDQKTKQYFDKFLQCKQCRKIYWAGSHYDNMIKFVDEILAKVVNY